MTAPNPNFFTQASTFSVPTNEPANLPAKEHHITFSPENEELFLAKYKNFDVPVRIDIEGRKFVAYEKAERVLTYIKNLKSFGLEVDACACSKSEFYKWNITHEIHFPELDDTVPFPEAPTVEAVVQEVKDGLNCNFLGLTVKDHLECCNLGVDQCDFWLNRDVYKAFDIDTTDMPRVSGDGVEVYLSIAKEGEVSEPLISRSVYNREELYQTLTFLETLFPYSGRGQWAIDIHTAIFH